MRSEIIVNNCIAGARDRWRIKYKRIAGGGETTINTDFEVIFLFCKDEKCTGE